MPGQQREADLRPDAGHAQQVPEQATLVLGGESVQQVRVLAHDEVRRELDLAADLRQPVEGRHGRLELVADAVDVDDERRRRLADQPAAQVTDHRPFPARATPRCWA